MFLRKKLEPGQATKIMTGAPIPDGADCVVMVEKTRELDSNLAPIDRADARTRRHVEIEPLVIRPGQNILRKASVIQQDEIVLQSGAKLEAVHLGLLAEIGAPTIPVVRRPQVSILVTGNELVEADQKPGAEKFATATAQCCMG